MANPLLSPTQLDPKLSHTIAPRISSPSPLNISYISARVEMPLARAFAGGACEYCCTISAKLVGERERCGLLAVLSRARERALISNPKLQTLASLSLYSPTPLPRLPPTTMSTLPHQLQRRPSSVLCSRFLPSLAASTHQHPTPTIPTPFDDNMFSTAPTTPLVGVLFFAPRHR
ncbi:hypothetical protein RHMOL_Rhmol08G0250800 [Rhododendron molle]|uniref:Uncharacterized protein n=1 Tax=Rhododendron molle TaxID=49168 RepID=A0ACC0MSF0_RHOML|nr:hypothetical protein RHMOL_Rhmol08G0250800 [Rhododendron molle]